MNLKRSSIFNFRRGKFPTTVFPIFLFFVVTAVCASPSEKHIVNEAANSGQEITFVAEVTWISLEGGFYGFVTENGSKFLPLNLHEEFRKDGLKVKIRGKIRKDVATIYMWGTPLEILEIELPSS